MNGRQNISAWWMAAVGTLGLGVGAGAMYLATRSPAPAIVVTAPDGPGAPAHPGGPTVIDVTAEAAKRAGLEIGSVKLGPIASELSVPGHVEANAYTQVAVKATSEGRITSFSAELGATVRRGQLMGRMFVPEVADQQRVFLSMRAELDAAHAKLLRTEQLVKLGSVSQQELEAVRASHTAHATDVEGVRARLMLLGVSAERLGRLNSAAEIDANTDITSPADGVVIRRTANPGLNVQAAEELATIADLSEVWVVVDVFERDLGRVKLGDRVRVTSPSDPGGAWQSTISYIDPQVVPETRTARLRAELQNPGRRLKIGQYVDVVLSETRASVLQVPREAVQTIGDRHFVYAPDPGQPNRFVEREVRVGAFAGTAVEILSGVSAGDSLVTTGSFFLRAERDRLGLPLPPSLPGSTQLQAAASQITIIDVSITDKGFVPDRLSVKRDESFLLRFTRKTDNTCAKAVAIPSLKVQRDLPLNVGVTIEVPAQPIGELAFSCGMNMLKGALVVK